MSIEVMKQALEALEYMTTQTAADYETNKTINALRQAIEDEEKHEPVAWLHNGKLHEVDPIDWATGTVTPLYTSPPAKPWVGLTDEEISKTFETKVWDARRSYARAIEAKLKEKNT